MLSAKNGSSRNGKIHSKLSFKAPKSQKFSTLQKIIFGENKLSKKDKLALKASKNGNFVPNICYSLNKSGGWEALGSLENVVNLVSEKDEGYPIAAVKCFNENWMKSCKRVIKVGENGGIQSYKIKSKRGTPLLSLLNRDSEVKVKKCEKNKKRTMEEKLEDEPLIMYKLNEWNSLDFEYRKDIKKIVTGKKLKKIRTNKILEFDESDFINYCDAEFDEAEVEEDGMEEEIIAPATTSKLTIGDCFVVKTPKTRKRKHLNIDFETVEEEMQKVKTQPSESSKILDEVVTIGDEHFAAFNQKCDIKVKGFFNFPSFISFEEFTNIKFMYDFHWLNSDETNKQCLFVIPQSTKNNISNFSSVVKLECVQVNPKNRYIRISINSVYDFDLESFLSKKHKSNPTENIIEIIIEMYNIFLKNSTPFDIKPPMTSFNPSLSPSSYPTGDFELLYQCQVSPSDSPKMDDFEIIYSDVKCNVCYKSSNLTTLQCSHVYCSECPTKSIKNQIQKSANILACEICETPFDPLFILSSTPLILLQHYLRFIKSKDSIVCPSCNGVLTMSKDKIKFGNVHCEECNITFCAECKDSPHFPLGCKEMKIWTSKVLHEDPYLEATVTLFSAWFTKNGNIQCYCDAMLTIPSNLESNTELECPECPRKYKVMWEDPDYYNKMSRWWYKINIRVLPQSDDFTPNIITKRIKNICLDAHFKTSDSALHSSMSKKISKLGIIDFVEAKNLYTTTLHLIEFGYAWLYLNRKSKSDKKPLIQKCLKELRGILSEFESRDFRENDVIGCEKLKQWKSLMNKILNSF